MCRVSEIKSPGNNCKSGTEETGQNEQAFDELASKCRVQIAVKKTWNLKLNVNANNPRTFDFEDK